MVEDAGHALFSYRFVIRTTYSKEGYPGWNWSKDSEEILVESKCKSIAKDIEWATFPTSLSITGSDIFYEFPDTTSMTCDN